MMLFNLRLEIRDLLLCRCNGIGARDEAARRRLSLGGGSQFDAHESPSGGRGDPPRKVT